MKGGASTTENDPIPLDAQTSSAPLVFFDLETTSMWPKRRITELALVIVSADNFLGSKVTEQSGSSNGQLNGHVGAAKASGVSEGSPRPQHQLPRILGKLTLPLNPEMTIDEGAVMVSGITKAMVEHLAPFTKSTVSLLLNMLEHSGPPPWYFVAHNGIKFDFPTMRIMFALLPDTQEKRRLMEGIRCVDSVVFFRRWKVSLKESLARWKKDRPAPGVSALSHRAPGGRMPNSDDTGRSARYLIPDKVIKDDSGLGKEMSSALSPIIPPSVTGHIGVTTTPQHGRLLSAGACTSNDSGLGASRASIESGSKVNDVTMPNLTASTSDVKHGQDTPAKPIPPSSSAESPGSGKVGNCQDQNATAAAMDTSRVAASSSGAASQFLRLGVIKTEPPDNSDAASSDSDSRFKVQAHLIKCEPQDSQDAKEFAGEDNGDDKKLTRIDSQSSVSSDDIYMLNLKLPPGTILDRTESLSSLDSEDRFMLTIDVPPPSAKKGAGAFSSQGTFGACKTAKTAVMGSSDAEMSSSDKQSGSKDVVSAKLAGWLGKGKSNDSPGSSTKETKPVDSDEDDEFMSQLVLPCDEQFQTPVRDQQAINNARSTGGSVAEPAGCSKAAAAPLILPPGSTTVATPVEDDLVGASQGFLTSTPKRGSQAATATSNGFQPHLSPPGPSSGRCTSPPPAKRRLFTAAKGHEEDGDGFEELEIRLRNLSPSVRGFLREYAANPDALLTRFPAVPNSLEALFVQFFPDLAGNPLLKSHRAEDDCMMLLHCCSAVREEFWSFVQESSTPFIL